MTDPPLSRCKNSKSVIAKKRKKQKVVFSGMDRLPDEILMVIVSRLTFKDAFRTSVVSRRWRYLWRFISGIIELDFDQWIGNCHSPRRYNKAVSFLSGVDQVVKLHQGLSVDKFIVRCVHNYSPDRICRCIRFAMQKEVRVFELNMPPFQNFPDLDKFLSISRAIGKPPKDHFGGGLSRLTSFKLVHVNIKNEMIEYLLSNCPHLEHLCIMYDKHLTRLNVVGPSLKSLILCFCPYLGTLKISATNLESFEYGDVSHKPKKSVKWCKFQFRNVPLLSKLKLKGRQCGSFLFMPSRHSEYSHQLERLLLDVPIGDMCWVENHSLSLNKLPQLRCLKQLEMTLHAYGGGSLLFFVMLTTACPLLSRFVVQFLYEARAPEQLMAAGLLHYERFETDFRDHHHPCLKLVKLIDIACYQSDLKFASALLQIAKSLDKIIIRPGTGYHGPGYLGPEKISTVRERAKSLEAYLAHGAKLVIL